jgi:hypothetical protein
VLGILEEWQWSIKYFYTGDRERNRRIGPK